MTRQAVPGPPVQLPDGHVGAAGRRAARPAPHIGQAAFISWDIERGLMTVHRWSPNYILAAYMVSGT
jgi:hypothetical protein